MIKATLVSQGSKGRIATAEVTVVVDGRSATRHLRKENGSWMGFNPDEVAVAVLHAAEGEVERLSLQHEANRQALLKVKKAKKSKAAITTVVIESERMLKVASDRVMALRMDTPVFVEFSF